MSGKDIDDMTFEKIKFWTVLSLKDFLGGKEFCCFRDEDSKLHGGQILFSILGEAMISLNTLAEASCMEFDIPFNKILLNSNFSLGMRFRTMWHFDMCRLRRASAAFFKA